MSALPLPVRALSTYSAISPHWLRLTAEESGKRCELTRHRYFSSFDIADRGDSSVIPAAVVNLGLATGAC